MDITAVKQTLQLLFDLLRHSGVGALPLLPLPQSNTQAVIAPTEQQLMNTTASSIHSLYERLRRSQESADVVANLLGAESQRGAR